MAIKYQLEQKSQFSRDRPSKETMNRSKTDQFDAILVDGVDLTNSFQNPEMISANKVHF